MKFLIFFLTISAAAQQIDLQRNVRGILPPKNGGTGVGISAANTVLISNGSTWVVTSIPACADTGGNHLNYSGGALTCGTSGGAALVSSVFGRTGVIVATTGDYTAANVTNAVDSTASYANPVWITSLSASKLTLGTVPAAALPNPTLTTPGGIREKLCGMGNFVRNLNADGTVDCAPDLDFVAPPTSPFQLLESGVDLTAPPAFHTPLEYITSDFNFTPQTPGGSLIIGANTVTMTPCPWGFSPSISNYYMNVTGGVGTAEACLVIGGTCTSGATTGTAILQCANTHSGAFTVGSASSGAKEAMNLLPAAGGKVLLPKGDVTLQQTLVIGTGTATTKSTINAIGLIGQGSGRGDDTAFPTAGATRLLWAGPTGGTVVKVLGPIGQVELEDFQIDGATTANIGLDIAHSYSSKYTDLDIIHWNTIGLRSQAVDFNFSGLATGNNKNIFHSVDVHAGTGDASSIACQFGQSTPNVNTIYDFASNALMNSVCRSDLGTGLEFRLADNNTIINSSLSGVTGLKFTSPVAGFPGANVLVQSPVSTIATSAGFDLTTSNLNIFLPLSSTDAPIDPRTLVRFASGFDFTGKWFGIQRNMPLHYASSTSPAAIANTMVETAFNRHYLLPKYTMNYLGAVGRIKIAGRVSSTGTPTLTFQIKLGGVPIGKFVFTVGAGVTNDAFTAETDFTVSAIGAGALLVGPSKGVMGGFSGATTVQTTQVVGQQGITWTNDNDITVTAQWSAASASNTVTLDSLTFEPEFPGTIQ